MSGTYKIIDSQGEEVMNDIPEYMYSFFEEVDRMRALYANGKFTKAEETKEQLIEKLDDVMRGF